MRRLVAALGAGVGLVLLSVPPMASAQPPEADEAVAALRTDSVYLHPLADRELDVAEVRAAIGDAPIKIAILPSGPDVGDVRILPRQMARSLPDSTIAVISGRYFYAGSQVLCEGIAGRAATNAINRNEQALDLTPNSDITQALVDFVAEVRAAPRCATHLSRGDRYTDEPGGGQGVAEDSLTALPWVLGTGAGLVATAAVVVLLIRRRTHQAGSTSRDTADRLLTRLAEEIGELPDTGEAGEAKADATARHEEAGTLLLTAATAEQFAAARAVAIEGLVTTRTARIALGREAGDPIPQASADGPPVQEHDRDSR